LPAQRNVYIVEFEALFLWDNAYFIGVATSPVEDAADGEVKTPQSSPHSGLKWTKKSLFFDQICQFLNVFDSSSKFKHMG